MPICVDLLKLLYNNVLCCFRPNLVVLASGMNDTGIGEKYLNMFRNNARECVNRIRSTCAAVKFGCGYMFWPSEAYFSYVLSTTEEGAELDVQLVSH